jgi:hypothetical protein
MFVLLCFGHQIGYAIGCYCTIIDLTAANTRGGAGPRKIRPEQAQRRDTRRSLVSRLYKDRRSPIVLQKIVSCLLARRAYCAINAFSTSFATWLNGCPLTETITRSIWPVNLNGDRYNSLTGVSLS